MILQGSMLRALSLAILPLVLGAAPLATVAWADDDDDDGNERPFSVASIFFELNNTDGDLGIHALIDGDPWEELEIDDPRGREILDIDLKSRLKQQGLTELFFESAEPTFDELAPRDFFRRFPEGTYRIKGESIDGDDLESAAELTHVLPAPPGNVKVSGMAAPEDCDSDPVPAVSSPVVITWDPVTQSHRELGTLTDQIEIVRYELVVEREEPTSAVMNVVVPPDVTSFEVPQDFLDLDSGDGFKFEILVREASGNQTATETCFELQ